MQNLKENELQDKLDKIEKDGIIKIEQAKLEHNIQAHIEEKTGEKPSGIFIFDLYGRSASVKFGDSFRMDENGLSNETALKLLKLLEPSPMYYYRDGCVSFRSQPKPEGSRAEVERIFPVKICLNTCTGHSAKLVWFHTLTDGQIIEIDAHMENMAQFGTISADYHNDRRREKYSNTRLQLADAFNGWTALKMWSSGEWPSDYQLYKTGDFNLDGALKDGNILD